MSLKTIKERADAATPGPWVRGWWSGQLPGNKFHADCKERGPLLGTLPGGYHVHPDDFYEDAHHLSMGAAPFTTVAGNYDYEAGGILSDPDAAFIAHARQDISALLRVAEAAADWLHEEDSFSPYDDSDAHAAVRAIEVAKEALRAALAELEALP